MSTLEILKNKLKRKPEVTNNVGVRILIKPTNNISKNELPIQSIINEADDGDMAQNVLKRIRGSRLQKIIRKLPEEPQPQMPEPIKIPEPPKKKVKKVKLDKPIFIEEEEEEKQEEKQVFDENEQSEEKQIEIQPSPKKPRKRITKKIQPDIIELNGDDIMIGDTLLKDRIPKSEEYKVNVPQYYMNNREIFVNFINKLFEPYKNDLLDESKGITCDQMGKENDDMALLTHQKIVKNYINLYTPYRGLLLYHGLGSGKTCSSIAIAEGMKSERKVIVMTPASLRRNYMEELKKCGDLIYRKNQYWEWFATDELQTINALSKSLGLSVENIRNKRGAWVVNINKPSNYKNLSSSDRHAISEQIDEMIQNKYTFINYNGLRKDKFAQITKNHTENIFDNAVVIIDEAHNLISRIVNKIKKRTKKGKETGVYEFLSLTLYEYLMKAENCKIILLTGTPMINYPNELGILFNILRGYIKTWSFNITTDTNKKLTREMIESIFIKEKVLDYVEYIPSSKTLTITRNPLGFENIVTAGTGYKGVSNEKKPKKNANGEQEIDEKGNPIYVARGMISDDDFLRQVTLILKKNDIIVVPKSTQVTLNTALPDLLDNFNDMFIDKNTGNIKNVDKFKRRIIGLTSYFRSAQEELLPSYDRNFDRHIVKVTMSDFQFKEYEEYRNKEREKEEKAMSLVNKNTLDDITTTTYRIFSRLACNFVVPKPPGRPQPSEFVDYYDNIDKLISEKFLPKILEIQDDKLRDKLTIEVKRHLKDIKDFKKDEKIITDLFNRYIQKYINNPKLKYINIREYFELVHFGHLLYPQKSQHELIGNVVKKRGKKKAEEEPKPKRNALKVIDVNQEVVNPEVVNPEVVNPEVVNPEVEEESKEQIDNFDFEKYSEIYNLLFNYYSNLELYLRTAILIDYLHNYNFTVEERNKFIDEAKDKDKEYFDDLTDTFIIEELLRKWYMHFSPDKIEEVDTILTKYINCESELFNRLYKKYVDKNWIKQELWFHNRECDKRIQKGGSTKKDNIEEFIQNHAEDKANLDEIKDLDAKLRDLDELEADEILDVIGSDKYKAAIDNVLSYLRANAASIFSIEGLQTYSPKFLAIFENIIDPEYRGLHLLYSQFRSMEGIGIFTMILDYHGFARFKIKRIGLEWELDMPEEDLGKPCYALYTGTEDADEKEVIRNIYNGQWSNISNKLAIKLRKISKNNDYGEIIKLFMITSAGSEGITLHNTRYVHIMEPYWHPVRIEQVIGRARRICSHKNLPRELQTVEVFIYLSVLSESQLEGDLSIELRLKDRSKKEPFLPQTTDEHLYEMLTIKEDISQQLLKAIKESSIDCATHVKSNNKEKLQCLSFGKPTNKSFSYNPNIAQDENDTVANLNKVTVKWTANEITIKGVKYILKADTNQVYDYDSVVNGSMPILVGRLVKNANNKMEFIRERS
jgi:hypothetical protein